MKLSNVTLLGIDCMNVERLQAALNVCEKDIEFGAVKLLTSLPTNDSRAVQIPHIKDVPEYSRFCIEKLAEYVDTDFVLIVQYDGFILNPSAWKDEFLNYDYIGAPWLVADWSVKHFNFPPSLLGQRIVGNGGFCIRSKKFLETSARFFREGKIPNTQPEDTALCIWHRDLFEAEGLVFAPPEVGQKFSIEDDHEIYTDQFGFHSFYFTNIDKWINEHAEETLIVEEYRKAQKAHLEHKKRYNR